VITFVCGRAGSGKSTYVAERIRERLQRGGEGKIYLIVPEQQAVVWESRAARELPPCAPLSLEIVNFTRLSELVARSYGGLALHPISRGGKAALMWSVIRALSDSLTVYGGKRAERLVPSMLSAVSEMKRSGVTPSALEEAAGRLADDGECAHLAARAAELSLIASTYSTLLHQRYDDGEDALATLAQRLRSESFFAGADVFVDSFISLTPVENDILYSIFRQADNVTVTFACPAKNTGEAQFIPAREHLSAMVHAARRAGRETETVSLEESRRPRSAALSWLEENLWRFDAPAYDPSAAHPLPHREGDVRVIRTADRYTEAEAAACRIAELVRGGAAYGQIAVIAREADALRGILDTALARHGIPAYFSEKTDVSAHPAARLIFCALSAVGSGWRREDVILCAKTGMCALTDEETDALESYADTWHLQGARSFDHPWNMNPDGYEAKMSERAKITLERANSAREKLVPPLADLAAVFEEGGAPVPQVCRAVYEMLCRWDVWDSLQSRAGALAAQGRAKEAAECAQMWDILMDALDTLADVLPEARADASSFSALLRQVLSCVRAGTIPSGADEVTVGSAKGIRLGQTEHVLLLGCVEGEFPGAPADDGFFSDADKIRLEGEGIILSGKTDTRMKEELFWFYQAVSLPRASLTVFLPAASGGDSCTPSLGAERILALLPHVKEENSAAWGAWERISHPRDARQLYGGQYESDARAALCQMGVLEERQPSPIPLSGRDERVSAETAALLFSRDIPLTQSRLDTFVLCRFGYYCRYIMKLEEKKEASVTAVNVGTFLHRVFEEFLSDTRGETFPIPEERVRALTDRIVGDTVAQICPEGGAAGRSAYLFSRLKTCVLPMLFSLNGELSQSRFRPAFFELPVGTEDPRAVPSMKIPCGDGHAVRLRGVVDRLDTWQDGETTYVRVVDYKTGDKHFAAEDISLGVNAQLLVYLFSVLRCPPGDFRRSLTGRADGEIRGAGALYFSARPGESLAPSPLSAEDARALAEKNVSRSGILLAEENVLRAMEADLGGKYIPVKAKKEGFTTKCAMTEEEIGELERTLQGAVGRIGREMAAGNAQARPLRLHGKNPCEWCQMKSVCRAAQDKEDR